MSEGMLRSDHLFCSLLYIPVCGWLLFALYHLLVENLSENISPPKKPFNWIKRCPRWIRWQMFQLFHTCTHTHFLTQPFVKAAGGKCHPNSGIQCITWLTLRSVFQLPTPTNKNSGNNIITLVGLMQWWHRRRPIGTRLTSIPFCKIKTELAWVPRQWTSLYSNRRITSTQIPNNTAF